MWPQNTRRKLVRLSELTETSQNPRVWDIPKSGILAGLNIQITGALTGTLSAQNALGFSSIIRRIRLLANSGIALIDVSGAVYHYMLKDQIEDGHNLLNNQGRTAITATTYDISMFFPIAVNGRDPIGLFMLQNEATQLRLEVEFEANANVATGITAHTNQVQPVLEIFSVPVRQEDWPPFNFIQQWTEESQQVSVAVGEVTYYWPRGNTYVSVYHGQGIGVSGANNYSQYRLRVNQSDYILDWDVLAAKHDFERFRSVAIPAGVIPVDFMFSSGLGNYGSARDLFDSSKVTDIASIVNTTATGTLYTLKRQLVNLG